MIAPASAIAGTVAGLLRDGLDAVMPHSVGISLSNAPADRIDSLPNHAQVHTPLGPLSVAYGGGLYAVSFEGRFGTA